MGFNRTWSRTRVFLVGPGYALAAAGEQGVSHMLQLVEAEVRVAMALTSCRSVREIGRSALGDSIDNAVGVVNKQAIPWRTAVDFA